MSGEGAELSLVILTEDSAGDARATIEALARRMLHLVVPGHGSHRIQIVPRDVQEEEAMRGSWWKGEGKKPEEHERRVRLRRYIARKLLLADTFVLFHVDGDRPWSARHTSENMAEFERMRTLLPQVVDRGRAHTPRKKALADVVEPTPLPLDRLLLVCPFRSIEAWLYQNVETAVAVCRREHRGHHVADLQAWRDRRGEIDELLAPEKVVCLGKDFNLELAKNAFPAREAYEVKKSFAETVDRLAACGALVAALERTRGWA